MIRDLVRIVSQSNGFEHSDLVATNIALCRDLLSNELTHELDVVMTLSFSSGDRRFSAYVKATYVLLCFCSESEFLMNGKKHFSCKEDYLRFLFINLMKGRYKFLYKKNTIDLVHSDGFDIGKVSGVDKYLLTAQIEGLMVDAFVNNLPCTHSLDKNLAKSCGQLVFPNNPEVNKFFEE